MTTPRQAALDEFGKMLMTQVYDHVCYGLEALFFGVIKTPSARPMMDRYRGLDANGQEVVRIYSEEAAIAMMAELLNLFFATDMPLLFTTSSGDVVDIQKLSDGLVGELYTEHGWIARFSKYKDGLKCPPTLPPPEMITGEGVIIVGQEDDDDVDDENENDSE